MEELDCEITTFGELFEEVEDMKYLIEPIIPIGYITLLSARGGIGKSAYALYLANKLVKDGKKVLYLDVESTASIFKKRCIEWNLSNWKEILTVRLKDRNRSAGTYCPIVIPQIDKLIEQCKPDIVIIDSLTALSRLKNLNDRKDVSNILTSINNIALKYNIAVLLLAHNKKNQDDFTVLDSVSGSGSITDFSRSVLIMSSEYNSDVRTITQFKNTSDRVTKPFTITITETGVEESINASIIHNSTQDSDPEVRSKETKIGRIKRVTLDLLKKNTDIKEVRRILKTEECAFDAEIKTATDWASKELNITWRK